jgi:3-hydroxyisobutyrate dehydrogenase-like beta-hydroxyacid dehydrogenase
LTTRGTRTSRRTSSALGAGSGRSPSSLYILSELVRTMTAAAESATARIGVVGLGQMGAPVAERLLAAGYPLVVHNRTREKADALVAAGAHWAFTPRDVGRAAVGGVVFTSLSDGRAVQKVLFGRQGLVRGLAAGALVVDLSTIAPSESRDFAARLAALGIHFVDAPLGGSVEAARNGRLLVFAGGAEEDVARARPFLERFSRRIDHLGPVGSGSAMKLVNNLLTVSYVALAGEALAFSDRLGLDRHRVIELLLEGGGRSAMLEQKRIALEERRYPAQFKLRLAEKDLTLVGEAAREAGAEVRIAREVRRLLREAERAGHGDEDFSAVFESAIARSTGTPTEPVVARATPPDPAAPPD